MIRGILLAMLLCGAAAEPKQEGTMAKEEISPNEDLMREHGVVRRILLAYAEVVRRIENYEQVPAGVVADAATIAKTFIENYHEKLEEEYIFPKLVGELKDLVATLKSQHDVGRKITEYVLAHSAEASGTDDVARMALADYLRLYIRMFQPHMVREDTVLFPAFRALLPADEYEKLGDLFEQREEELFGKEGFQAIVSKVSAIEQQLNIAALSQFTAIIK